MGLKKPIILHAFRHQEKIMAAGKRAACKILLDWAQSVSNHVYWCAASSDGNEDLVKAKWLSVLNHVSSM